MSSDIQEYTVIGERCRACGDGLDRNNPNQVIYFCSKECRKKFRSTKKGNRNVNQVR